VSVGRVRFQADGEFVHKCGAQLSDFFRAFSPAINWSCSRFVGAVGRERWASAKASIVRWLRPQAALLLLASIYSLSTRNVTDIYTPEFALRIRVKRLPASGEFDGFELGHFRVGEVYTVPSQLASVLILAGCAALVDGHPARAEAADFGQPKFPRRS
jgi:hypothetical protein